MRFELYRSKTLLRRRPEWRWRLRANNSLIIANSGEGYVNRADAVDVVYDEVDVASAQASAR